MAFTALFTESIYGCNGNDWKNSNGVVMAFPSQTVLVRPLEVGDPTTMAGVTMAAKIQLIQPGLALPSYPQYYTPRTVAQCVTDANS